MSRDGYLPPGVEDYMIPGNSKQDAWFNDNEEDLYASFIAESEVYGMAIQMHLWVYEPTVLDDDSVKYFEKNYMKIAKSYFKANPKAEADFDSYCDKKYEDSFDTGDDQYDAWKDAQADK
jgi:hypothetical protein